MRRSSWSRSSHKARAPVAARQSRPLCRSRPSPSRRRSRRGPGRGTVSAGRWHMSRTGCRSSVGGCRAGRRTGRGGRPWDSRGAASGLPRPRLCGRTAAVSMLLCSRRRHQGHVRRGEARHSSAPGAEGCTPWCAASRGWHGSGGGKGGGWEMGLCRRRAVKKEKVHSWG
jgi:hypothetical protein